MTNTNTNTTINFEKFGNFAEMAHDLFTFYSNNKNGECHLVDHYPQIKHSDDAWMDEDFFGQLSTSIHDAFKYKKNSLVLYADEVFYYLPILKLNNIKEVTLLEWERYDKPILTTARI